MTQRLQLQAGDLRCEIAPAIGGCITNLWWRGMPVLRPAPAHGLISPRQAGSFALVPYSNRIGDAAFSWDGAHIRLQANNLPEPHAIHGTGWRAAWSVEGLSADAVALRHLHRSDAHWPFDFTATMGIRLSEACVEMRLAVRNDSRVDMPAGLGWHPYFVKRAGAVIRFGASGRWEMGADKLPTGLADSAGLDADCSSLAVDHCFEGWGGVAELVDASMSVRVESDLSRLVVFTDPARDFVAIEPVSHVNNGLNMAFTETSLAALGVRRLRPGERLSAAMSLRIGPGA